MSIPAQNVTRGLPLWATSSATMPPSIAGPVVGFHVNTLGTLRATTPKSRDGRFPVKGTEFDQNIPRFQGLWAGEVLLRFKEQLQIWVHGLDNSNIFEPPLRKQLKKCFLRNVEPSFTLKELIAFAILSTRKRVAGREYIYKWICTTFPHYANKVTDESLKEYLRL